MANAGRGMKSSLEIGLVLCCPTEKGCIPVGRFAGTPLPHRAERVGNKLWRLMFRKSKPVSLAKVALQKQSPREERKRELRRQMSDDLSKKSSRHLRRPRGSLWIRISRVLALGIVRSRIRSRPCSARLLSCEFYDVVSICRSLGVVDPFLQSDGAVKRLLRSSERPLRLYVSRVYGSHDPDAADLRGHHDDLHGSDTACQACIPFRLRDGQIRVLLPFVDNRRETK